MRYKIKDISDEGLDLRVAVTETWLKTECSELDLRPSAEGITFVGRLERTGNEFLLRGAVKGGLVTSCARCLEAATVTLDLPITATFAEREQPVQAGEGEAQDDEVTDIVDGVIDLGPEIRDELLLALPIGPLCREDCAGICPTCGVNRNLTPCDCGSKGPSGSKFAALAKMKLSAS